MFRLVTKVPENFRDSKPQARLTFEFTTDNLDEKLLHCDLRIWMGYLFIFRNQLIMYFEEGCIVL